MLNVVGSASWTACLAAFAAVRVMFTPPRSLALWGGLLGLAFLVGAQPAAASCPNTQTVWPSAFSVHDTGLYVAFSASGNPRPPRYCYNWRVRYQDYGAWTDDTDCDDMSNFYTTLAWETVHAHADSPIAEPGDTGYFEIRARAQVPACSYNGVWSSWRSHTFTVPDSD